jgi:DNA (cytosine-5)-methyltransferase 1
MLRVIRETKPRWVIGENVEGIVNINEGMVLKQVLTDLENEGFKSQCIIIPASGIGAWHQRKRIWILAYSNNNGSYRSQGNATKQSSNEQKDRLSFRDDKDVPNTNTRLSIREKEEIQTGRNAFDSIYKSGERQWWEAESKLRGIPDGLSTKLHEDRSNRIRALGNSIVPQIARQIGLSIMEAELNG